MIVAPAGWAIDSPPGDDITIDIVGEPRTEQFVSFVLRDESAYLGRDHPQLDSFFESSRPPGEVQAFLSGRVDTIGPAAVPEPAPLALIVSGLIASMLMKSSRPPASLVAILFRVLK
jgi:hypothetical protein